MSEEAENLLAAWSELLVESLADAGVSEAIISPGSRNTPFVVAFARSSRIRCHDVIDERAAAFFALGQARVTGRPSVALCTSGSAAAHYLPAIIEAAHAATPMLLLTADRPFELQQCGASQTIDQIKLFGDHARAFFELGLPDASPGSLRALRRIAAQSVAATLWPLPGAVHINARARKPLEPRAADSAAARRLAESVAALRATPVSRLAPPRMVPDAAAVREVAATIRAQPRGLLIAGPLGLGDAPVGEAIAALAARAGYPLFVEASSQARFAALPGDALVCDAVDTMFRSKKLRDAARPDVILQFGGTPTATGWEQLAAQYAAVPRIAIGRHGWNAPQGGPTFHVVAEPADAARAIAAALDGHAPARDWLALFASANEAAWCAVHGALADERGALNEGDVARAVVAALPPGSLLALGNSLPVRLVDTFCERGMADARVLVQRGASGIDGLVAGVAGTASVAGAPLTLLIGDVSLLHDLTSLVLVARAPVPVVVVVIQNQGGRIFEQLPVAAAKSISPAELSHITTPHELGFEHAARMFGLRYACVRDTGALRVALAGAHDHANGATLIEAIVPPHGAAQLHARAWSAADRGLEALLAGSA